MGDLMFREPRQYLRDMWDEFMDLTDRTPAFARRTWSPAVDVKQTDKAYVLEADLPGMTEDDIDVRVESDRLVLSSSKEEEEKTEEEGYIRRERYQRTFNRTFRLPSDVNEEKIDATFRNGVLTITMPRSGSPERESGRKIKVTSK